MSHPVPIHELETAAARLWKSVMLLAILLLGLGLRLVKLAQNGWGNEYYTAGVRSMTTSWHNFLYNSFDPAGFVSVDKPPVALWIQAASAKFFGFHAFSVLMPQVLEGVAAVWIVYHLVQRGFGARAGLLAALFLAITPISVAIDRSSNTDSCLVLVLLLATWALIRAAEEGSRRFLLLSMALIGLGFNVKMLAAFVVLPAFVLVYYLGAPVVRGRRLADLAIAGLLLIVVSLSWVLIYDLTPPEQRPFAGTTKKNSMLELAVGPYAVGRFVSPLKSSEPTRSDPRSRQDAAGRVQWAPGEETPSQPGDGKRLSRLFVRAPAGPLRLADGQLAGQVGWLFPLAIMGLVLAAVRERFRKPPAPTHLALLLWFCWAVAYGVVYSFAGGIMHLYYLATLAPALAALAGIGVACLWDRYAQKGWGALLLPASLVLTAVWQIYINASAFDGTLGEMLNAMAALIALRGRPGVQLTWLHVDLLAVTLFVAGGSLLMLFRQPWGRTERALAAGMFGIGLLALLAFPMAWAWSSVIAPGHGTLPSADPARLLPGHGNSAALSSPGLSKVMGDSKLVRFLKANSGGERFLLATSSARLAAPIIISTGGAVMAMGGFHGLDPILSPEKLERMVQADQVRFVMLGDWWFVSRMLGAEAAERPIADWVRAKGRLVDSTLWRSFDSTRSRLELYDLRPDVALVQVPSR
ncbi:MAG: glycosyltransferase family 39 protein [Desulfomonile tiedjei]|nr:glycosyltransferase family 39 protein [Desulfomonile tiedjei]